MRLRMVTSDETAWDSKGEAAVKREMMKEGRIERRKLPRKE